MKTTTNSINKAIQITLKNEMSLVNWLIANTNGNLLSIINFMIIVLCVTLIVK